MVAVDLLLAVPAAFLALGVSYLIAITLGAFLFRKPSAPDRSELRMALLAPAHNEERQIEATLDSLLGTDYPPEHRAIFVVADNCTDLTAELARGKGATVFEREDPQNPGKGQALDWCLKTHAQALRAYDIIVLVDADVEVDAAFLREIRASMAVPGVDVLQTYYGVGNPGQNWRTALTYAGFALMNHVRACGRRALGGSAGLKGTGMAFRGDLLLERGWPAHSIVEDMEYSLRLLSDGVCVHYNPDARLVSAMPAGRKQAAPQRRRWESGRIELAVRFVPGLAAAFLKRPRMALLDAALELMVPPLSLLVMVSCLLLGVSAVVRPMWAPLAAYSLAGTAFHVIGGLLHSRAPAKVWLYLFCAPVFLVWKIPLYAGILLGRKQRTWERTEREGETPE